MTDEGTDEGDASAVEPDGGAQAEATPGEPNSRSASEAVNTQFELIRQARRKRAIGWLAVIGAVAFLFYQAVSAVELASEEYQVEFFIESLQDFFPVTEVVTIGDVTVYGLAVGEYWAFITRPDQPLLFDPSVAELLWTDPVTFFFGELGIFSVFGQAGITLAMGVAGTVIGFPLALFFGVLGSERVTPFPFNFLFRGTMSAIRAIPAIIWMLILIPLAGLGAAAATLAIAIDTIGNLGRLFVDELEEIEDGPIEAMEMAGANYPQKITFGMLSQVKSSYIAWTLYITEINVRIAVTLGAFGAGGLGNVVEVQVGLFQFTNVMATLMCIFVLIISVELFSQRLRSRLRSDEEKMGFAELILGFPDRFAESMLK